MHWDLKARDGFEFAAVKTYLNDSDATIVICHAPLLGGCM